MPDSWRRRYSRHSARVRSGSAFAQQFVDPDNGAFQYSCLRATFCRQLFGVAASKFTGKRRGTDQAASGRQASIARCSSGSPIGT